MPRVAIIGAGPAGLMAADVLSQAGVAVDIYDAMRSPGRKFLLAGIGGMNITHAEPFEKFVTRYGDRSGFMKPFLQRFGADQLRDWIHALGVETFVGSSGRVFPVEMKAAPLLRKWLHRLRENGVKIHTRHRWLGWRNEQLVFVSEDGEKTVKADAVVLALGGASWPQLGSDGSWFPVLAARHVALADLQPANCGFDIAWSEFFAEKFAGSPLKSIAIDGKNGECVITASGIEGGLVYALSSRWREMINEKGSVILSVDLAPGRSAEALITALAKPRGKRSMGEHLRKSCGIAGAKAALLRECFPDTVFANDEQLAAAIKSVPLKLVAARPLPEAISTAGGVCFESLDETLMLHDVPGVFCAGEMLDWEAPTGGYLLTACFATGRAAGEGVLHFLRNGE
ncbi:MAG TPA: TIGR03862 family flavoprotein [Pseudomonadales bacterium]|nr:TIGR03862 family flavoprotein [Pseudomonadales bacterium]